MPREPIVQRTSDLFSYRNPDVLLDVAQLTEHNFFDPEREEDLCRFRHETKYTLLNGEAYCSVWLSRVYSRSTLNRAKAAPDRNPQNPGSLHEIGHAAASSR